MKKILIVLSILLITGCSSKILNQEEVEEYFRTHKVGASPDYAVIKNGTDHLATIHGMADDKSVCLDLIKIYNEDPSLSIFSGTYTCVPLNK